MLTRRQIISLGATTLVVAPTAGTLLHDRFAMQTARSPWAVDTDSLPDPRLKALAYAILAPSPHNRQPWRVALEGDDTVTVWPDLDRLLPQTDPLNRQITIGLGAMIEQFKIAATLTGHIARVEWLVASSADRPLDNAPIARLTLAASTSVASDNLAPWMLARRTHRQPYALDRSIPDAALNALVASVSRPATSAGTTSELSTVSAIKEICHASWLTESNTARTHNESVQLTRIAAGEVAANPDGISLGGPLFRALRIVGVMTREKMAEPDSFAYDSSQDFYSALIDATNTFGWITTEHNDRLAQLHAGAAWLRWHLTATKLGIAIQPLSQALQEFPEMRTHYAAIHRQLTNNTAATVQGLFRLGYADVPPPSPRWPLSAVLMKTDA
ncbi:MAG: twin-arginine translocation pathway signal protein [Pseudomonadota bacterium]